MGREYDRSHLHDQMFDGLEGKSGLRVDGKFDMNVYLALKKIPGFEDFNSYTSSRGKNGYPVDGCACGGKQAVIEVGMLVREVGDQGDLTEEAVGTMDIPGLSFRVGHPFRRGAEWTIRITEDRPGSRTGFSTRLRKTFPLGCRWSKWAPENGVDWKTPDYNEEMVFKFWGWAIERFVAHIELPNRDEILRYR